MLIDHCVSGKPVMVRRSDDALAPFSRALRDQFSQLLPRHALDAEPVGAPPLVQEINLVAARLVQQPVRIA